MTIFAIAFSASASLADPSGSSPLVAAATWLEGTVLGTVASTLALIAVAGVGMMMLTGRIHLRRGGTVILGCFILFGAPGIALGMQNALRREAVLPLPPAALVEPSALANLPKPAAPSSNYDPYAGASLPPR
ncbi:MAG: TrbC/VirB2 family protein [Sphingomonas sp.]